MLLICAEVLKFSAEINNLEIKYTSKNNFGINLVNFGLKKFELKKNTDFNKKTIFNYNQIF